MDGVGGHAGWRWIFLLEGIITIAFGFAAYFLIVDFPEDAKKSWKFLTEDEIKTVIDRINRDRQDVGTSPFNLGSYLKNALDWKIWFFAANFGLTSLVTYAAAYFLPIVLREGLGFSEAASNCLSTPVRLSSVPHRRKYNTADRNMPVLCRRINPWICRKPHIRQNRASNSVSSLQLHR